MRWWMGVLAVGVVGCLSSCNKDEARVKEMAVWLCQHNQLDTPTLQAFPTDIAPANYVSADDLAYLEEQSSKSAEDGGLFGGLAQVMESALTPVVRASSEALSRHTTCKVKKTEITGARATVELERTTPKLDVSGGLERIGELTDLGSHEARIAKVEEWISKAKGTVTESKSLGFVKGDNGWRADYQLQEKAEEEKQQEIAGVIEKLEERLSGIKKQRQAAKQARAELDKFKILQARFYKKKQSYLIEPIVDLTVKNETEHAVSRAYFIGTLKSPDREIPWLKEDFNYEISGGLEPGEQARWRLNPNRYSAWGSVEPAKDAVLNIEVVRLDGAEDKQLYSVQDPPVSA